MVICGNAARQTMVQFLPIRPHRVNTGIGVLHPGIGKCTLGDWEMVFGDWEMVFGDFGTGRMTSALTRMLAPGDIYMYV